jgi:hypothetical protein
VTEPLDWLSSWASRAGLSYEPEADERWLRAFEPFATLRTPIRYEHAVHAIGKSGSLSIARLVVSNEGRTPHGSEAATWIAFVQDFRMEGARIAATNDYDVPNARRASFFAEPMDLISMPRRQSGEPAFDYAFASFATSQEQVNLALTPSLRRLVLGWRIPLHFEVRPGSFVVAPVSLGADPQSLAWLVGAVQFFGEKAAKRVK